jgi:tetratricopeptide (TPR) repeat protein
LRHHFADGVLWARLDGSDTLSVLTAFAEAYQRDVSNCLDVSSRSSVVRDLLSSRHALIVLDNAQTSEQIDPLLPPTGKCAVLVTTRRQDLAVLVGAKRVEIQPFAADAAASQKLFAQILGAERARAEADLLAQMADELGHLPLALVIAASRLAYEPGWDTAQFGERLQRVSQRLQSLRYEGQSVHRSFQLSYDLLDPPTQQLLAAAGRLGRQDFGAMALAALTLQDEAVVADGLRQLFSLSLVQGGENGRYALHPLLHDFAQSLSEPEALTERLVAYWAEFVAAHRYAPGVVVREMGHIQGAVETAIRMKMIRPLRRILDDLMLTLFTRGAHTLAEQYLLQAQAIIEAAQDVSGQSWVLLRLGQLEQERHHLEAAENHLRIGLDLARQQQDETLEAQFLTNLGIVYNCLGDYEQGKALLLKALPLARRTAGDDLLRALEELGILLLMDGDKAGSADYYQEGLALSWERQNEAQAVLFLKSLGALAHLQGEAAQAEALFEQGVRLAQRLDFRKGIMLLANNLGVVAFGAGEMARAEALLQMALKEAERLNDANALTLIGLNLGYWARRNARFSLAQHTFTRVLALAKGQEWEEFADIMQGLLDDLAEGETGGRERPLSPAVEHLKVFI